MGLIWRERHGRNEHDAGGNAGAGEKAITTVLCGGQSYKIGGLSVTRADLAMLKVMRDDLEAQVAQEESSFLLGRTSVAFFDSR